MQHKIWPFSALYLCVIANSFCVVSKLGHHCLNHSHSSPQIAADLRVHDKLNSAEFFTTIAISKCYKCSRLLCNFLNTVFFPFPVDLGMMSSTSKSYGMEQENTFCGW